MKEIKQLLIYGSGSVVVILILIALSKMENIPTSALVISALLLVVVLPVIFAVKISKKEREKQDNNA